MNNKIDFSSIIFFFFLVIICTLAIPKEAQLQGLLYRRRSTQQSGSGQKVRNPVERWDSPFLARWHLEQLSSMTFRLLEDCCEIQFQLQPQSDWVS